MADGNLLDDDLTSDSVPYETFSEGGVAGFSLPAPGFSTKTQKNWAEKITKLITSISAENRALRTQVENANRAAAEVGGVVADIIAEDSSENLEPLKTPSAPKVVSRMGNIEIFWDGTDFEGTPMGRSLAGVNVYAVKTSDLPENPDFNLNQPYDDGLPIPTPPEGGEQPSDGREGETPEPSDPTLWPPIPIGVIPPAIDGGNVIFSDLEYNTEYTIWFIAKDVVGNMTPASDRVTQSVQPLVNTDLIGRVIDGANIELDSLDEMLFTPSFRDRLTDMEDGIDDAIESANGKNRVWYRPLTNPPANTGNTIGDTWFVTDDGNKVREWNGTSWSDRPFGTNAIENLAITNAKIGNLDAAKITTGFLSADRILTRSLGADKLVIGDSQNYWLDPTFSNPMGYGFWSVVDAGLEKDGTGTQHGTYFPQSEVAVQPGERLRFIVNKTHVSGTTSNVGFYVQRRTASGGAAGANTNVLAMSGGDGEYTADWVVPAGVERITFGLYTQTTTAVGTRVRISNIRVYRMLAGQLIVDGTIAGDKLLANSITGDKIVGNTITGDKIAALSIDTGHLKANAITADKVAAGAITGSKISGDAIDGKTITGATIRGGTVTQYGSTPPVGNYVDPVNTTSNNSWGGTGPDPIQYSTVGLPAGVQSKYKLRTGWLTPINQQMYFYYFPKEYTGARVKVSVWVYMDSAGYVFPDLRPEIAVPAATWTKVEVSREIVLTEFVRSITFTTNVRSWVTEPIVTVVTPSFAEASLRSEGSSPGLFFSKDGEATGYITPTELFVTSRPTSTIYGKTGVRITDSGLSFVSLQNNTTPGGKGAINAEHDLALRSNTKISFEAPDIRFQGDTDWTTIPLASGWVWDTLGKQPAYRVRYGKLYIRGRIKRSDGSDIGTSFTTGTFTPAGAIPALPGIRGADPSSTPGAGVNSEGLVRILSDGSMQGASSAGVKVLFLTSEYLID